MYGTTVTRAAPLIHNTLCAFQNGIHYVHIDPCQLRNCNYVIGGYACAKYLGVGKNDCVNTKHERVIVNTKRKQVILRSKLLQFKVIQINLLSSGGSYIID